MILTTFSECILAFDPGMRGGLVYRNFPEADDFILCKNFGIKRLPVSM